MVEKKQLILRIPYTLWEELNKMADEEYRSLNSQIEYILTKAVRNKKDRAVIAVEEVLDALKSRGLVSDGSQNAATPEIRK